AGEGGGGEGGGGGGGGGGGSRHDHVLASRIGGMARLRDAHRRPEPERPPAHLDRAQLGGVLQDLHQLRDDIQVHLSAQIEYRGARGVNHRLLHSWRSSGHVSSSRSVAPSDSSCGPSSARCTSSSIRTPPCP